MLFEFGPDGAGVLEVRQRMGLDSGYLSRMLRQLETQGALVVSADPDDARHPKRSARPVLRDLNCPWRRWPDAASGDLMEHAREPTFPGGGDMPRKGLCLAVATDIPKPL